MTLIEILIAVVIGLILIAGTMQIYLSNKQSSRSQDAMAYMNNNARYAFNLLQNTVSLAGFRADPSTTNADAFPSVSASLGCPAFGTGDYVIENTNTAGDLFCVRMQSPFMGIKNLQANDIAELFDCTAATTDTNNPNRTFITRFFINNNILSCQTSNGTAPLIDDVLIANRNTDLLYGIDTDNDKVANKYINGAAVTSSEWDNVIGLRVTLTAQSNFAIHGDVTSDPATTQITKAYTQTLTLRSRAN